MIVRRNGGNFTRKRKKLDDGTQNHLHEPTLLLRVRSCFYIQIQQKDTKVNGRRRKRWLFLSLTLVDGHADFGLQMQLTSKPRGSIFASSPRLVLSHHFIRSRTIEFLHMHLHIVGRQSAGRPSNERGRRQPPESPFNEDAAPGEDCSEMFVVSTNNILT